MQQSTQHTATICQILVITGFMLAFFCYYSDLGDGGYGHTGGGAPDPENCGWLS